MRLLSLGLALGVSFALFVACGDSDSTSTGDKGKATGGTGGTATAGEAGEAGVGNAGAGGTGGDAGAPSTGGTGGTGGAGIGPGGGGGAAEGGAGTGGEGGDEPPPECTRASECDDARGPSPCGSWACNSLGQCEARATGCSDDDRDGYGAGAECSCAGLDCDDDDAMVQESASESCYTGPTGTRDIGVCRGGNRECVAGVWGPCAGEVLPSGEACNSEDDNCDGGIDNGFGKLVCGQGQCKADFINECENGRIGVCVPFPNEYPDDCSGTPGYDDDCDGAMDEGCATGPTTELCFRVTPGGDDQLAAADSTGLTPFGTVQAAIDHADTHRSISTRVCLAPGVTCGESAEFPSAPNQPIAMRNGISVYGGYESGTWSLCPNSRTRLKPRSPLGVSFAFSASGLEPTRLSGVEIDRADTPTTAGITVDRARNVILSNVVIESAPTVMNSYGVNVVNGGQATVFRSRIVGGAGSVETVGVRAVGSQVLVEDNCLSVDTTTGRCDDSCDGTNPGIRARATAGTGSAYSVLLVSSPGSRVERSALCDNDADTGAQVRVSGNGSNILVRANLITARGGALDSHGIWLEDCNGGKPWIVDNERIEVAGDSPTTRADAIHAVGDCHPVIDSNVLIQGAAVQGAFPTGVRCTASAGISSRCLVANNFNIRGSEAAAAALATGVRCENGSCVRVVGNTITGGVGTQSNGVWLVQSGPLVERNLVRGGCAAIAVGIQAEDAWARIENNRVFGYWLPDCPGTAIVGGGAGLRALVSDAPRELDVHSNLFDGSGAGNISITCRSRAVTLAPTTSMPSSTPKGVFRNNIFRAGTCALRYGFEELFAAADPRVLENNDFDPADTPTALYLDEGTTPLATPSAIDALVGTTASGTLSVNPQFTLYPDDLHLLAGSMCIDSGTSSGAPSRDMDGAPRTGTPDLGPDEYSP